MLLPTAPEQALSTQLNKNNPRAVTRWSVRNRVVEEETELVQIERGVVGVSTTASWSLIGRWRTKYQGSGSLILLLMITVSFDEPSKQTLTPIFLPWS
eukprot:m.249572 g.249572  ORF g.249572 m.249572 type:complete len:98 (+) comp33876_c1_seq1:629-922(+)